MTDEQHSPGPITGPGEDMGRFMGAIAVEENSDSGPSRYKSASLDERRRIQGDVIDRYRPLLQKVVRRYVRNPEHWRDAIQEAVIGLLIALERYDDSSGTRFDPTLWIVNEVRRWLAFGVYWAPVPHGRGERQRSNPSATMGHTSLEALVWFADVVDDSNPEEEAARLELYELLEAFLSTLTDQQRHLLLCEKRETRNVNSRTSRGYLDLVERARAFVRGPDGDDISRSRKTR